MTGKDKVHAIKELIQAAERFDNARPSKYESPKAIMRQASERASRRIEAIFARPGTKPKRAAASN